MLHWSVVPEELIFEGMDKVQYNWIETEVGGVAMVVEPAQQAGCFRIVRLLSPNPQDYLNPEMAPGSLVELSKK
ncbi:MAG: hypothetical protein JWN30_292 [Bacilli bacterium]|nr:hypothetical protein [Bacilli bacterium]